MLRSMLMLSLISSSFAQEVAYEGARKAPFCVNWTDEKVSLGRFQRIFDQINESNQFIPVSPDTYQSPTGFIKNVSLSRIRITSNLLKDYPDHVLRKFQNFFHITIKSSEAMEGLYVQAIGAPLGIPFGEFVTDFDCGDCYHPSSKLAEVTSVIPCSYLPAASYLHPTVLAIGGGAGEASFDQAHFNFRYVDYPCFDVIYAQFFIVAVRSFERMEYDVFFTSIYKVDIEGIGSPYPMYYGWTPKEIKCHKDKTGRMDNWIPQNNERMKVKVNLEYDHCVTGRTKPLVQESKVCPPGPVHCGYEQKQVESGQHEVRTAAEWIKLRRSYVRKHSPRTGTDVICTDCGTWHVHMGDGPLPWSEPSTKVKEVEIDIQGRSIPGGTKTVIYTLNCERRDAMGKNEDGDRDTSKDSGSLCEYTFDTQLRNRGYRFGQKILKIHGILMLFVYTMGTNCLIYCARFLKETSVVEERSGCFGIGNWLWHHTFWTYLVAGVMWSGVGIFGVMKYDQLNVICYSYDLKVDTDACRGYGLVHRIVGIFAVTLYLMGYASGWDRPTESQGMRNLVILYHIVCGYLGKYVGLINLMATPSSVRTQKGVVLYVSLLEGSFWLFFLGGTLIQKAMDSQERLDVQGRRFFPTVEAIDTATDEPLRLNLRTLLYPALILVQSGLFFGLAYHRI